MAAAFHLYSEHCVGPAPVSYYLSPRLRQVCADASVGNDDIIMIASLLATPSGREPAGH